MKQGVWIIHKGVVRVSTLKKLVVVLMFVVGTLSGAVAQTTLPVIGNDWVWVDVFGYTQVSYLPDSTTCPKADRIGIPNDQSDFQWGLCRVKFDVKSMSPWGFFSEIEAVDLNDANKNWLRQAYLSYKVNTDWSLNAGRLFLAQGSALPGPVNLETVRFPRVPINYYGYGLQVVGNLGNDVSLISDVSGKSGVSFDGDENWDRLESSTRLTKKITKNLNLSGTVQLSDDYTGYILDSEYHLGNLFLKGAGYTRYGMNEVECDNRGFYTYAGYEILKGVELHAQYDYQNEKDDIWTAGTRLWTAKDRLSLTVDYEYVPGNNDDNRVIARVEARF